MLLHTSIMVWHKQLESPAVSTHPCSAGVKSSPSYAEDPLSVPENPLRTSRRGKKEVRASYKHSLENYRIGL